MSLADRTVRMWDAGRTIRTPGHYLEVHERELYTSYRLISHKGTLLWIDVRNVRNVYPRKNSQIIYARRIPWFMWIWYGIKDLGFKLQWWRLRRRDERRGQEIREYQKRVSEQQFVSKSRYGGRYK